jgi:hypothetical protein
MYHTATSSGDGSEPIDRRHAALGRHPIGRDDHNLAALILNELCGIVEEVVDFRVGEVIEIDAAGREVEPARDMSIRIDQECPDPTGYRLPGCV